MNVTKIDQLEIGDLFEISKNEYNSLEIVVGKQDSRYLLAIILKDNLKPTSNDFCLYTNTENSIEDCTLANIEDDNVFVYNFKDIIESGYEIVKM